MWKQFRRNVPIFTLLFGCVLLGAALLWQAQFLDQVISIVPVFAVIGIVFGLINRQFLLAGCNFILVLVVLGILVYLVQSLA